MHFISSAIALLLAGLSTIATANEIHLDATPEKLAVGEKYEITWTSDSNYTLEMLLVEKTSSGWKVVTNVLDGRTMSPGSDSYRWTVPNVDSSESRSYGLWMQGSSNAQTNPGNTGYADLTPWFTISGGTLVSNDHSLTKAQLAGIVVGALVVIAVIGSGAFYFVRRRRAEKNAGMLAMVQSTKGRTSMDSIEVEKERVRLAAKGSKAEARLISRSRVAGTVES